MSDSVLQTIRGQLNQLTLTDAEFMEQLLVDILTVARSANTYREELTWSAETTKTVTHSLGNANVLIQLIGSSGETIPSVLYDVARSTNSVQIVFAEAQSATYTVVVVG